MDGTYVGNLMLNAETSRLMVWDGRRWVDIQGGVDEMMNHRLPLLTVAQLGGHNAEIYLNGMKLDFVHEVDVSYRHDMMAAECTLRFPCRIVHELSTEEKAETVAGLRDLLRSLES